MTVALLIAFAFCAWCLWAVWPERAYRPARVVWSEGFLRAIDPYLVPLTVNDDRTVFENVTFEKEVPHADAP